MVLKQVLILGDGCFNLSIDKEQALPPPAPPHTHTRARLGALTGRVKLGEFTVPFAGSGEGLDVTAQLLEEETEAGCLLSHDGRDPQRPQASCIADRHLPLVERLLGLPEPVFEDICAAGRSSCPPPNLDLPCKSFASCRGGGGQTVSAAVLCVNLGFHF